MMKSQCSIIAKKRIDMYWFGILISFIIASIFTIWLSKKDSHIDSGTKIMFMLAPVIVVALTIWVVSSIMKSCNTDDVEYLHYYYTKIRHEDAWNERVTVTKTRTRIDSKGHSHVQTYTVKETRFHPENFYGYLNDNCQISLSENAYETIKKRWNVEEVFIDMHRNFYTIDGDAQEYIWDGNPSTIKTYVKKHHYTNKIVGSGSAFKFNEVSNEDAKFLGLYEYPEIDSNDEQNPVIGYKRFVSKDEILALKRFNALNGLKKELSVYLLIYSRKSASIVEDQRSYWQGGNKNEFVICVGIDSISNEIKWTNCFSWQDDIAMDVKCRNFLMTQKKLDVNALVNWLDSNKNLWHRKEFNDFDYINIELSPSQELAIWIIVIVVSIIAVFAEWTIYDNC